MYINVADLMQCFNYYQSLISPFLSHFHHFKLVFAFCFIRNGSALCQLERKVSLSMQKCCLNQFYLNYNMSHSRTSQKSITSTTQTQRS